MRKKIVKLLLGFNADDLHDIASKINNHVDINQGTLSGLTEKINRINDLGDAAFNILKAQRDNGDFLRNKLWSVRDTSEYKAVFKKKEPLVTVRIATYENADKLINVAIKSVLNQTHKNIEIIVVGDHVTDNTEARIKELNDPRITFINLPYRSIYPDDGYNRWLVAGSPGMNIGAHLAKGDWIAPLDDDDAFAPDHIEKLLKLANDQKAEFVYGAILRKNTATDEEEVLYSDMPKFGEFSFQSVMYMKQLSFFEYDQQSWVVGEPGDWNLCRRMLQAGVRVASTEDVVTTIYMTPRPLKNR
ncbi:MAG: glycosyltransferase [Candidatus Saccharimonadales bacterium]